MSNGFDAYDIDVARAVARMEAKLDSALEWQKKHEEWSQARSKELDAQLKEQDRRWNLVRGAGLVLSIIWTSLLVLLRIKHP